MYLELRSERFWRPSRRSLVALHLRFFCAPLALSFDKKCFIARKFPDNTLEPTVEEPFYHSVELRRSHQDWGRYPMSSQGSGCV